MATQPLFLQLASSKLSNSGIALLFCVGVLPKYSGALRRSIANEGNESMTEVATRGDVPLNWEVFVTPGIPMVTSNLPPGAKQGIWSPISSTLIYGKRDAVLVDAFITIEQANALVDWVAASGKNLTTIYVTHGHGDHFFGAGTVLERFPSARFVATPNVVKIMRQQASPQSLASFWNPRFPGQISD